MKLEFLCVVKNILQHFIDTKLLAAKTNSSIRQFVNSSIRQFVNSSIRQFVNSSIRQFVSKAHLKKFFLVISSGLFLTLSSCNYHLDASLEEINKIIPPAQPLNLKNPEFFVGEVVTTNNGSVVKGIFGETSEKQVLSNNVVIEGAFYE